MYTTFKRPLSPEQLHAERVSQAILFCILGNVPDLEETIPYFLSLNPIKQKEFYEFGFLQACQYGQTSVIDYFLSPTSPFKNKLKSSETDTIFSAIQSALYGQQMKSIHYLYEKTDLSVKSFFENKDLQDNHCLLFWQACGSEEENTAPSMVATIAQQYFQFVKKFNCQTHYLEAKSYTPFIAAWEKGEKVDIELLKIFIEQYRITGQEPPLASFLQTSTKNHPDLRALMAIFQQKKELENSVEIKDTKDNTVDIKKIKI